MKNRLLNILIGDLQPRVRFGLRLLLEQQQGWRVVGEVEDAELLKEQIKFGCPDLVLLDWELPGIPVTELITTIRKSCPRLWVVFMSSKDELRQAALHAGRTFLPIKLILPRI